jgi:hypothetical protein
MRTKLQTLPIGGTLKVEIRKWKVENGNLIYIKNSKDQLSKLKRKGVWVKINGNESDYKQHYAQQDKGPAHKFFLFENGKNSETGKSQGKYE